MTLNVIQMIPENTNPSFLLEDIVNNEWYKWFIGEAKLGSNVFLMYL